MDRITWGELVTLEPRLIELEKRIKSVKAKGKHFCANRVWYADFKEDVCCMVGWEIWKGSDPRLGTSDAYDVAYHHLYNLLPGCRDCNCM